MTLVPSEPTSAPGIAGPQVAAKSERLECFNRGISDDSRDIGLVEVDTKARFVHMDTPYPEN